MKMFLSKYKLSYELYILADSILLVSVTYELTEPSNESPKSTSLRIWTSRSPDLFDNKFTS